MRLARSGDFDLAVLPNGARLLAREAPLFKTVLLTAILRCPLGARAAETALLPFVLKRGCRAFPTELALRRHLESMYGATFDVDVSRIGDRQVVSLEIEVPAPAFLGAGAAPDLLDEALQVLRDVLTDPVVDGGGFRGEVVAQEKEKLAILIRSLDDQKDRLAYEACRRSLAGRSPAGIHPYGEIATLRSVDRKGLLARHREWLSTSRLDLYAMGPVRPAEVLARAARILAFPRGADRDGGAVLMPVPPGGVRRVRIRQRVRQAKLCLGYAARLASPVGRAADALAMMSGILGGYPHSKLFREVREKAALAYSASSFPDRACGWLFVQAGVEPGSERRAADLVEAQLDAIRRGEVSREELEMTRRAVSQRLRQMADLRHAQIDAHYEEGALGGTFSRAKAARDLARIGMRDVVATARGLRLAAACVLSPRGRA